MNWSRDYSNLGQVCPEKALLRALSDSTEKTDFDLYYEYFKKFKLSHSHVNLQGNETRPNRAEKMARTKLFNLTQPDRPPAFLDLSNWAVSVIFFYSNLCVCIDWAGNLNFFNFFRTRIVWPCWSTLIWSSTG